MTKRQLQTIAREVGYEARYSGKQRKFYYIPLSDPIRRERPLRDLLQAKAIYQAEHRY
jgi:hypothetical protein